MLQVEALSCRRGGRGIFHNLSLSLDAGGALLVLGENGSGKSTLLRVLAGLLPFSAGKITWKGQAIDDEPAAYRQGLHYIGHQDAAKPELSVAETLDYWRTLSCAERSPNDSDPFGVRTWNDKPVRYLSAGQKRRLALSRLVLTEAPLWLLDEPLTALDRAGQDILVERIAAHRAKGGMAVIATHQDMSLADVARHQMTGGRP